MSQFIQRSIESMHELANNVICYGVNAHVKISKLELPKEIGELEFFSRLSFSRMFSQLFISLTRGITLGFLLWVIFVFSLIFRCFFRGDRDHVTPVLRLAFSRILF